MFCLKFSRKPRWKATSSAEFQLPFEDRHWPVGFKISDLIYRFKGVELKVGGPNAQKWMAQSEPCIFEGPYISPFWPLPDFMSFQNFHMDHMKWPFFTFGQIRKPEVDLWKYIRSLVFLYYLLSWCQRFLESIYGFRILIVGFYCLKCFKIFLPIW